MDDNTIQVTLSAVVVGLIELVKQADPENRWNRFYPIFTELLGFTLGMVAGVNWLPSLLIGLSAMGIYRGTKVMMTGK